MNKHITDFGRNSIRNMTTQLPNNVTHYKENDTAKNTKKVEAIAKYKINVTQIPYILHKHYDMQVKVRYI